MVRHCAGTSVYRTACSIRSRSGGYVHSLRFIVCALCGLLVAASDDPRNAFLEDRGPKNGLLFFIRKFDIEDFPKQC